MSGNLFFDTNIVVYAYNSADPRKQKLAQQLLSDGLGSGTGHISPQVLSEFFVVVTRKVAEPLSADDATAVIKKLLPLCRCSIDRELVRCALALNSQYGISYWDALIVAAAERLNCSTLYSEDLSDGQKYGNLTVTNPFST